MNKFESYQKDGGCPILMNDLRWILGQDEYATAGLYKVLEGYLNSFGTDFIISGCVPAGSPGAITEGWIFLGGEIIKVDAHTGTQDYYEKITDTYHADGNKTFQDGTTNDTYQQIRAKCTAVAGALKYNGATLKNTLVNVWADFTPSYEEIGTITLGIYKYQRIGKTVIINFNLRGTPVGTKTYFYMDLPIEAKFTNWLGLAGIPIVVYSSIANEFTARMTVSSATKLGFYRYDGANWANTEIYIAGQLIYETV